ncbi:MAG: DUF3082 domain-containing protein [Cyanobacteria bacterium P01_H01_bin.121]
MSTSPSERSEKVELVEPDEQPSSPAPSSEPTSVWRCLTGAAIAGSLAVLLYLLTTSIAQTFADKPIRATSYLAANIGAAVRTLVVGSCTLATVLFAVSALGLIALGIRTAFQSQPE